MIKMCFEMEVQKMNTIAKILNKFKMKTVSSEIDREHENKYFVLYHINMIIRSFYIWIYTK